MDPKYAFVFLVLAIAVGVIVGGYAASKFPLVKGA